LGRRALAEGRNNAKNPVEFKVQNGTNNAPIPHLTILKEMIANTRYCTSIALELHLARTFSRWL